MLVQAVLRTNTDTAPYVCNEYAAVFNIYVMNESTQNMNLVLRITLLEIDVWCISSYATVLLKEMAIIKEPVLKPSTTHLFSEARSK